MMDCLRKMCLPVSNHIMVGNSVNSFLSYQPELLNESYGCNFKISDTSLSSLDGRVSSEYFAIDLSKLVSDFLDQLS